MNDRLKKKIVFFYIRQLWQIDFLEKEGAPSIFSPTRAGKYNNNENNFYRNVVDVTQFAEF